MRPLMAQFRNDCSTVGPNFPASSRQNKICSSSLNGTLELTFTRPTWPSFSLLGTPTAQVASLAFWDFFLFRRFLTAFRCGQVDDQAYRLSLQPPTLHLKKGSRISSIISDMPRSAKTQPATLSYLHGLLLFFINNRYVANERPPS